MLFGTRVAALLAGVAAVLVAAPAGAQRQTAQSAQPAPAPQAQPAPAPQTPNWESFPTMQLERVYRGPLRDTVVQRWRDPVDGTVCFLYIPISAPLIPQQAPNQQYVQYGSNIIGSVSCVHPTQLVQLVPPAPARAAAPAPGPTVAEAQPQPRPPAHRAAR